jgi:hypothetical protein
MGGSKLKSTVSYGSAEPIIGEPLADWAMRPPSPFTPVSPSLELVKLNSLYSGLIWEEKEGKAVDGYVSCGLEGLG